MKSYRLHQVKSLIVGLLGNHRSPREIALALALGVWIGVSPFWGFHTLMAIGLSIVFRLNAAAVLLGTMISNPWCAPVIIIMSLELGVLLLRKDPSFLSLERISQFIAHPTWDKAYQELLVPYLVGSLVLGTTIALLTFWISLWVARRAVRSSSAAD